MKPGDEVVRQISAPARLINAHRHLHLRPRRVAFIFWGLFFLHLLALACAPARDWSLDVEHGLEKNTLLIGTRTVYPVYRADAGRVHSIDEDIGIHGEGAWVSYILCNCCDGLPCTFTGSKFSGGEGIT